MKTSPEQIVIVGPEISPVSYVMQIWEQARIPYDIIGNGIHYVNQQDIDTSLKEYPVDTTIKPHIHYWGHGQGSHTIKITSPCDDTKELMERNNAYPAVRHGWSCNIARAQATDAILHSGSKYTSITSMEGETMAAFGLFCNHILKTHQRFPNQYEAFEFFLIVSPETLVLRNAKGNYTARAPKFRESDFDYQGKSKDDSPFIPREKLPTNKEELHTYLEKFLRHRLEHFRKFRKSHGDKEETFLSLEDILAPKKLGEVIKRYAEFGIMIEADRKKSTYGKQYVETWLNAGVNVKCILQNGMTPLYMACSSGKKDVAELLIGWGADVNCLTKGNYTPIEIAYSHGHFELVDLIQKHGAILLSSTTDAYTPLYIASKHGQLAKVEQLLSSPEANAMLNKQCEGSTPLFVACFEGKTEIVQTLLKHNADINIFSFNAASPLIAASFFGHTEIVDMLLKHPGVDKEYLEKTCVCDYALAFSEENKIPLPNDYGALFGHSAMSAMQLSQMLGITDGKTADIIADKIEARIKELTIAQYSGKPTGEAKGVSLG